MAPMKSSREMAVAQASSNDRKRSLADSDSDVIGDSDSDFSMTQTGGRLRAKKRPKNATSTKTSARHISKNASSAALVPNGVKLPREMACPEGITPFSKAHWKVIVQTDDFWEYLNKMVPPNALKTRLIVSINSGLKAEQAQRQEAKEAKTRVRQPSAVKGGPVNLEFSARDGGTEPKQQDTDRDGDAIAQPTTSSGQVESGQNQVQEKTDHVEGEKSAVDATRLLKDGLTYEQYSKGIEEQKKMVKEIEARKARGEAKVKVEDVGAKDGGTGTEGDPEAADN